MSFGRKWIGRLILVIIVVNAWLWFNWLVHCGPKTVYRETNHEYRHVAYNLSNLPAAPAEFIKGKTSPEQHSMYQVPNIVHYIWYQNETVELRFDKALSILSAIKNLKPDKVYFHTNKQPTGKYFDMLREYSVFKIVHRDPPTDVIKNPPFETTYSDYDKVKILIEQGGIYLDMDVMVVRPFDDILKYSCTLGLEDEVKVCAGIIVCAKEHQFLYVWLDTYYDDYEEYKHIWAFHSGHVPSALVKRYPHLVHLELTKLHRPGWRPEDLLSIWGNRTYNWKDNYALHTYIRKMGSDFPLPTEESIRTMKSTYGQIARQVYYGSEELQPEK